MIVDTHVHVLSDDTAKYPRPGKGPSVQPQWPDFTGEMLMQAMDESGIDRALTVQAYHTMRKDLDFLSAEDQRWIFGQSALRLWPTLR